MVFKVPWQGPQPPYDSTIPEYIAADATVQQQNQNQMLTPAEPMELSADPGQVLPHVLPLSNGMGHVLQPLLVGLGRADLGHNGTEEFVHQLQDFVRVLLT